MSEMDAESVKVISLNEIFFYCSEQIGIEIKCPVKLYSIVASFK